MIKEMIVKLMENKHMTQVEAKAAMDAIMGGEATQAQIGSFLTALRLKGETVEEITGFALSMREKAIKSLPDVPYLIDTCGTGGDNAHTFNISTGAAIIAAAAGVHVAKHGNRSVSSRCGSADVLEALGVRIELPAQTAARCIEETGFGFLFAQLFHGAMKHAAGPRRELGIRTVFNLLGPLTNPAGAQGQLMGVYEGALTETVANVLKNLGTERAMVIHSLDGLDEISVCGKTKVSELKDGGIVTYELDPRGFGMPQRLPGEITGEGPKENAASIHSVFEGAQGAKRDILLLNAGAAIYVGKKAKDIAEGVTLAKQAVDSGAAMQKLNEIITFTNANLQAAAL
jgi:anthranilate phosphoribosyltransferase